MIRTPRTSRPTRALTLIEVLIVLAFSSVFAVLIGSILQTSGHLSSDTAVAEEAVSLATRIADHVEERLLTAENVAPPTYITDRRYQPTPRSSPSAPSGASSGFLSDPSYTFAQRIRVTPSQFARTAGDYLPATEANADQFTEVMFGAYRGQTREMLLDGALRYVWSAETSPRRYASNLPPGVITEAVCDKDINGDGVISESPDEQYVVGVLTCRYLRDAGSSFEGAGNEEFAQTGRLHVLWNVSGKMPDGSAQPNGRRNNPLPPIFSIASLPASYGEADIANGSLTAGLRSTAIRLNITVLHDPIPGPAGQVNTSIYTVTRTIAPR